MKNVWALSTKELRSYFASPMAYIILAAFLVATGYFFSYILVASRQATMRYLFDTMGFILLLLSPILTMRLLSEEQRTGTIEILLTGPVRDIEVVLGKYLASLIFIVVMLGLTLYYPLLLSRVGNPDPGPIISGYLGLLLFGATFLAIGLLMSSLTQNQIVSAVLTFVVLILMWTLDASGSIFGGSAASLLHYLALTGHVADFGKGVIDTKDVVYYLSLVATGLFLTARSLETRRWR
ncbi:MAG: ABC transporter permease [Chloroflexi bacterium]|nr:ABC transporter permease [Chloroflexota bacterium]